MSRPISRPSLAARRILITLVWLAAASAHRALAADLDPWAGVRETARVQLRQHPDLAAERLDEALTAQDRDLTVQTIRLDDRALVTAVSRDGAGEVFIISIQNGDAQLVWSAARDAARGRPADDPLRAWRTRRPADRGPDAARGPLSGELLALPAGPGGEPRFAINATYAQQMGASVAAQLTVWRWTGRTALPLSVTLYAYGLGSTSPVSVEGDRLRIREKGTFAALLACDACEGRRRLHTLALSAGGVTDQGVVDLDPDLVRVDTLLTQALRRRAAGPGVSPDAGARLEAILAPIRQDASLGMLNGWAARGAGARRQLCLATDAAGVLLFTLDGLDQATRVVDVVAAPDDDCGPEARG